MWRIVAFIKGKKKAKGKGQKAKGKRQKAKGKELRAAQDRLLISNIASQLTTDHSQLTIYPKKISGVKASLYNHTTYFLHQLPGII
ncbi:hypothetical protein [Niastella koreensis]|uniref:hypothetical protein n=1 Tax=Niastella koreensis TaxID=354356 RepID=UPI0013FD8694|nr:hypothetical protein [Niastella koreensis]